MWKTINDRRTDINVVKDIYSLKHINNFEVVIKKDEVG